MAPALPKRWLCGGAHCLIISYGAPGATGQVARPQLFFKLGLVVVQKLS